MATAVPHPGPAASLDSFAEVLESIGDVPLSRIRATPAPGTATEKDVIAIHRREKRLYELIDGVLVEKTMGYYQSLLALTIGHLISTFLDQHPLGVVAGADGMIRFSSGVRIPDVSFVAWTSLPSPAAIRQPILAVAPDLAVEVLSESNTRKEMARKLQEYFESGVKLVWYLDSERRIMEVYRGLEQSTIIDENGTIDGGDVLPGFTMSLAEVFTKAEGQRRG